MNVIAMGLRQAGATLPMLAATLLLSATTPESAVAETMITLIGTGPASANDWPLLIARRKGYFKDLDISVDYIGASSTAAAIQQIAAGSGQIATGGLTDPMRAIDQGAKVAIARLHQQVPPYTLWGKPALKSFADLRGKLVMVGGAKDITRIYLDRMAEPNKLKKGDYDLVYAGTTPARFAALQSGAVDAAILLPPVAFRAEAAGFSMLGRLSDYVKDLPFTGYAMNIEWAKANKPAALAFLKAYQRGLDWFLQDANKAEAVDILAEETKLARADSEATYDYYRSIDIFSHDGVVTPQSLASLVKALAEDNDLQGTADPARFIDPLIAHYVLELK